MGDLEIRGFVIRGFPFPPKSANCKDFLYWVHKIFSLLTHGLNIGCANAHPCALGSAAPEFIYSLTVSLPNTRMKSVFNDTTQKTCSRNTREPSRPNSLSQVNSSAARSHSIGFHCPSSPTLSSFALLRLPP